MRMLMIHPQCVKLGFLLVMSKVSSRFKPLVAMYQVALKEKSSEVVNPRKLTFSSHHLPLLGADLRVRFILLGYTH